MMTRWTTTLLLTQLLAAAPPLHGQDGPSAMRERVVDAPGGALILPVHGDLVAQQASPALSLTLAAGAFSFDLSGTGTAPMGAVRLARDVGARLRVEGSLVVARPHQQFDRTTTFLAPEVQLQWAPGRVWKLEPYLGMGAGWTFDIRPEMDDRSRESFHAALGTRFPLTSSGGLVGEVRPRFIETGFHGSAGDFTLGWYQRF